MLHDGLCASDERGLLGCYDPRASDLACSEPIVLARGVVWLYLHRAVYVPFAEGVAGKVEDLPHSDAVHRMTVEVTPEGLGPVKVTAEVSGGALHVSLAGASEAARQALKAAVGDLQRELATTSFTQTTVDVRADSGSSQQGRSADAQSGQGQQGSAGQQGSGQHSAGHSARSAFSGPRRGTPSSTKVCMCVASAR